MGAGKPDLNPTEPKPPKPNLRISVRATVVVLALSVALYVAYQSEFPTLAPHEEARLQKRLKEIDDSEQYALVAAVNGWYPCLHSGRTTCFLFAGEVWKYGVTSKGSVGRYSVDFLKRYKVSYVVEF